jgi:hypothetical protein
MPIETQIVELDPDSNVEVRITISGPVADVVGFKRRLRNLRLDQKRLQLLEDLAPGCVWRSVVHRTEDGTIESVNLVAIPAEAGSPNAGLRQLCDLHVLMEEFI